MIIYKEAMKNAILRAEEFKKRRKENIYLRERMIYFYSSKVESDYERLVRALFLWIFLYLFRNQIELSVKKGNKDYEI